MSFQQDLESEVTALIVATISGATISNVFQATKAAKINILEKARDEEAAGRAFFPFWIVDAGEAEPDGDWGCDNSSYRCPLTIMEFRKTSGSNEKATIQADLQLLEQAIKTGSFTNFMQIEDGAINTSPSDPAVASLLETTLNAVAGTLSYDPGVLCGIFQGLV